MFKNMHAPCRFLLFLWQMDEIIYYGYNGMVLRKIRIKSIEWGLKFL